MLLATEVAKGLKAEGQEIKAEKVALENEEDKDGTLTLMLSIDISGVSGGGAALAEKLVGAKASTRRGRARVGREGRGRPVRGREPHDAGGGRRGVAGGGGGGRRRRRRELRRRRVRGRARVGGRAERRARARARPARAAALALDRRLGRRARRAPDARRARARRPPTGSRATATSPTRSRAATCPCASRSSASWLRQSLHGAECDALADGLFEYADRDRDNSHAARARRAFNEHPERRRVLRTTAGDKKAGSPRASASAA